MSDYGNNAEVAGNLTVTGSSTFNQDSADVNFIVETDDSVNTLWIDGANNNVGIGCAPSGSGNTTLLSVSGTTKIGGTVTLDVEDGGVDLRILSSADNGDYFQIQTTTHGATTITTVDDDATAADLTFTIDGDILLDPAGGEVTVDGNLHLNEYIYHKGDTDTNIRFTDDDINITVGNINFMDLTQDVLSELTINEAAQNLDVRIEAEAEPNMFFTDASAARVGIGTGAPSGTLHVSGPGTSDTKVIIESLGDSSLWIVADTDDAGGEAQNPSFYMSQETATDDAYQFHMGLEGLANQTYTGSFTNQPFILSQNSSGAQLRTFQIATDDGGDVSSRLSIGSGGKVIVGDGVGSADARLHVKEVVGDIFKLENTTAYGVTYGQLVKADLTINAAGSTPIDTTLNLPAASIIDSVVIKMTTPGAVSSGTNYNLTNITLDNGAQAFTLFSASFGEFSLIGNGSSIVSGTMYYFNNIQPNYPVGGVGVLNTAGTADIKLDFTDANVSTNAIVDVAVYYRKFDTIR